MKWIIDRIENKLAVIECGDQQFEIPTSALPKKAKEGSVIQLSISKKR